jgi:hypothetical protein
MARRVIKQNAEDRQKACGKEGRDSQRNRHKQAGYKAEVPCRKPEDSSMVRMGGSCHNRLEYKFMAGTAQIELLPAQRVAQEAQILQAQNGVCYTQFGDTHFTPKDLEHIVQAVPAGIAGALKHRAYYFVPLTISEEETTLVAPAYTIDFSDRAICHRNVRFGNSECIFISTRLMQDRFALAFEYFINVGRHFVDEAGVPESFCNLAWSQAQSDVRGETSQDAYEHRRRATAPGQIDEKAKSSFFEAAFSDAIAIYMLSLTVDFDYMDLREREYPLLASPALAERLRHVAGLFPPNSGYEFEIRYRRRS